MYDGSIQELAELDFGLIRFGRVGLWQIRSTVCRPVYVVVHGFCRRLGRIIT